MRLKDLIGTNYYANIGTKEHPEMIHLGKLSYGYKFIFRANAEYYKNYEEFENFVKQHELYNHFGRLCDKNTILKMILNSLEREEKITDDIHGLDFSAGQYLKKDKDSKGKKLTMVYVNEDFGMDMSNVK